MSAKIKVEVRAPIWVSEIDSTEKSFTDFLMHQTLTKAQNYKMRSDVYARKYGMDFPKFEKQVLSSPKEDFEKWDDYIVWKALYDSYKKWDERYKELRQR